MKTTEGRKQHLDRWGVTSMRRQSKIYERDGVEYKLCTLCEAEHKLDGFYRRDEGWSSWCKQCERAKQTKHYHSKKVTDASFWIDEIMGKAIEQRGNSFLALVRRGDIPDTYLATVLKAVEF